MNGFIKIITGSLLLSFLFFSCEQDMNISESGSESSSTSTNSNTDNEVEGADYHDEDSDYSWDESDVTDIALNSTSITVSGDGATADGSVVTITAGGNYNIHGTLSDGQVVVNSEEDDAVVRLILNTATIYNSSSSAIYVEEAYKTIVILPSGSENYLSDGATYTFEEDDDEPNATLFSKDDLSIYGDGTLSITANYNDAITSKDGLVIASGNITVSSIDDGIRGKDYLVVRDGNLSITSTGDGMKSDNDEDDGAGCIVIDAGTIKITSDADGMQAENDLVVTSGTITIESGGGSNANLSSDASAKALKATDIIQIDGGTFSINAADDAIHAENTVTINGGTFDMATGDDGIHGDSYVTTNGGTIVVSEAYEGIEAAVITINSGDIWLTTSDDGINASDGSGSSGGMMKSTSSSVYLYLYGGSIVVNASGDGLDCNGTAVMTGGDIIVHGPTSSSNGALDYDQGFTVSGGILFAAGSSGMAEGFSSSSSQYSLKITFSSTQSANTIVHLETESGEEVFTYAPEKSFASVIFTSPELSNGETYNLYYGGSSTGDLVDGAYEGGEYTAGTLYNTFTISSSVTSVGSSSSGGGGNTGGGGGGR